MIVGNRTDRYPVCADQDVHSIHANGTNPDFLVSGNNLKSQILHVTILLQFTCVIIF